MVKRHRSYYPKPTALCSVLVLLQLAPSSSSSSFLPLPGLPKRRQHIIHALSSSLQPAKPKIKPSSPCFSSGPTKKRPHYSLASLPTEALGRSHRSGIGQARLKRAIDLTRDVLQVPDDYLIGIVPGGDTGAYEMAMWNLVGDHHAVEVLAFDAFGWGWYDDIVKELRLDNVNLHSAPYGTLPSLQKVDYDKDVCFCWNGTTSGVCLPKDGGSIIPKARKGLTLCDATSAAFSMHLPWEKLDVTTFSWQKALGGEGAHGVIILSPKAIDRLQTQAQQRPIPKIFRLVDNKGKVNMALFQGSTINTPSMLCVEDYIDGLEWVGREGGLNKMVQKSQQSLQVIERFVDKNSWLSFLAKDPSIRSSTSVCLELDLETTQLKALNKLLEEEEVAYDIASYRDAPPGLRIWCGATVLTSDVQCLMSWIEWAYFRIKKA